VAQRRTEATGNAYDIALVTRRRPGHDVVGLQLVPTHTLREPDVIDTLIVAGGLGATTVPKMARRWIQREAPAFAARVGAPARSCLPRQASSMENARRHTGRPARG
jgi:hypothetical protein